MDLEILYHDTPCSLVFDQNLAGRLVIHQDDYIIFHDGLTSTGHYMYMPGIAKQAELAAAKASKPTFELAETLAVPLNSTLDSSVLATLLGVSSAEDVIALRKEGLI